ncbi:hypothetical protein GCM10023238_27530 [Streptomyces heliomycini]
MAEVIYNRLKTGNTETNGMLEFDSTYNYIKNQSKIDLTIAELRNYDNPYNTYFYKGLPPGPISNPGEDAVKGALDPTVTAGTTSSRWTARPASSPRPTPSTRSWLSSGKLRRRTDCPGSPGGRARLPIAHSLSPVLHRAAYAELGLRDWTYDRFEVDETSLPVSSTRSAPSGRDCR